MAAARDGQRDGQRDREPAGGVIVRPALADDAETIARIYNHHVDAGGATFDTIHWDAPTVRRWLPPSPPAAWYVVSDDKRSADVIGWGTLRPISERNGFRFTLESGIYLAAEAVGTGVADPLQRRLLDHCREHHIHHVMARIIADNARSIAFHRRHGFETIGVQKQIGHLQNRWVDLAVMQCLL